LEVVAGDRIRNADLAPAADRRGVGRFTGPTAA
jgi:hypothetical protein